VNRVSDLLSIVLRDLTLYVHLRTALSAFAGLVLPPCEATSLLLQTRQTRVNVFLANT